MDSEEELPPYFSHLQVVGFGDGLNPLTERAPRAFEHYVEEVVAHESVVDGHHIWVSQLAEQAAFLLPLCLHLSEWPVGRFVDLECNWVAKGVGPFKNQGVAT